MEKINIKDLGWSYIKHHKASIYLLSLFFIIFIFICIFFLYNITIEPIVYAGVLSFCVGIIWSGIDFLHYMKHHQQLIQIERNFMLGLEELPMPCNLIEEDYRNLVITIYDQMNKLVSQGDIEKQNMIDYYTLWAHQIKTPIAAIRLLAQLEEKKSSPELLTELFKIEQYVEMVLSYLRLDSHVNDLVIQQYSLDNIVKSVVRKYALLFIHKKINLQVNIEQCQVITDEKWLAFVIEQILSNALKYTIEGTIHIYMEGEKTFVIEDTGIGIAEEDLPRIFENSFTGYNGRMHKKATGIGLYLCKKVLTKLSHTIEIESVLGKGTKVRIDLDTVNLRVE